MTKQKQGYKRIMGEIPEEMYDKITCYNQISARPLNVSKAIELCIGQAVKKIDEELIAHAADLMDKRVLIDSVLYFSLLKDFKAGLRGPKLLQKDVAGFVKDCSYEVTGYEDQDTLNNIAIIPIYPIDRVEHEEKPERLGFYARGTLCFDVHPVYVDYNDDVKELGISEAISDIDLLPDNDIRFRCKKSEY